MFRLGARSRERLLGVHPDLKQVVALALSESDIDFTVLEGRRSETRQRELVDAGKSKTMNSRHLTGHAVDLGALINNKVNWSMSNYRKIATAMKRVAKKLGTPIEWGGDWKTFKDGPHFQLPWKDYPIVKR